MNDEIKEIELDYITNLQQENEIRQQDINNLIYQLAKMKEEKEDYKSRCERAIEYINNGKKNKMYLNVNELLDILQTGVIVNDY